LRETAPQQLKQVLDRIEKAARAVGRDPQEVTLVAVTKTVPLEHILPFLHAGIHHLGENRVQEAMGKFSKPEGQRAVEATLHLIGQLQTNKAKKAVGFFDMVQSVDRLELAQDLNRHARDAGKVLPCLIEVKLSDEAAKSGLAPETLDEFIAQLREMASLKVQGLMGIAPQGTAGEAARPYFAKLRTLWEKTKLEILSMGMSSDFEAAIAEGSTMVRLGTALFGSRG
jgi:PLP dependent protein